MNYLLQWPPQPSTVIGLGILGATIAYFVTGDTLWAGVVGAGIKILVPDSSARNATVDNIESIVDVLASSKLRSDALVRLRNLAEAARSTEKAARSITNLDIKGNA